MPSKPVFTCVPSQNGLFLDCPQRHSRQVFCGGYLVLCCHSFAVPSESAIITCFWIGISPETRYGPFLVTLIFAASSGGFFVFDAMAQSVPCSLNKSINSWLLSGFLVS